MTQTMKDALCPWNELSPYSQAIRIGRNEGLESAAHLLDTSQAGETFNLRKFADAIRAMKEPTI